MDTPDRDLLEDVLALFVGLGNAVLLIAFGVLVGFVLRWLT